MITPKRRVHEEPVRCIERGRTLRLDQKATGLSSGRLGMAEGEMPVTSVFLHPTAGDDIAVAETASSQIDAGVTATALRVLLEVLRSSVRGR